MNDFEQERTGIPVDLTRDEFVEYHVAIAKTFGTLRMQLPTVILFLVYLVVIGTFAVTTYVETGIVDIVMILMLAVTVACGGIVLYMMPRRVKKTAVTVYEAGNINGYYGEISITQTDIKKDLGKETVSIPLNERTMYLETESFMAFSTVGENRAIILPARCVTEGMAKAIRNTVFAPDCRVVKRIVKRMTANASEPIARREWDSEPQTLAETTIRYEEKEVKKQMSDMNLKKYIESLPLTATLGLMLGAMFATAEESLLIFFITAIAVVLGMLLVSMLNAGARAKQMLMNDRVTIRVALTDRGVRVSTPSQTRPSMLRWESVEKAVENPDSIDIIGAGQFIRIPKRCIDDVQGFIAVVDKYVKY